MSIDPAFNAGQPGIQQVNPSLAAAPIAPPVATHLIVTSTKSIGVAILCTIFFGPLGLLYATVSGALIVIFGSIGISILVALLGFAGRGGAGSFVALGVIGMIAPLAWIVSIVWAVVAVNNYNTRLMLQGR